MGATDEIFEVIKQLAAEKDTFTSDDLRPLLPEGSTSRQIPSALGRARRERLIEEIDRVRSIVPERKGSLVPVFRSSSSAPLPARVVDGPGESAPEGLRVEGTLLNELRELRQSLEAIGYVTGLEEVATLVLLLASRNWLILAGPSGTGKSSVVSALATVLGAPMHDVQVKPNWVSSEDSLGYFSEVSQQFIPGPFYAGVRASASDPDSVHFMRLDELNLASPEYYLAEVLSATEQWTTDEDGVMWSASIQLPPLPETVEVETLNLPNYLFLIGTVNVDETTRTLSPKVLDRAAVFEIPQIDLFASPDFAEVPTEAVELPEVLNLLKRRRRGIPGESIDPDSLTTVAETLEPLNEFAAVLGGPIAYRQRNGILSLLALASEFGLGELFSVDDLIDVGIMSFVLPKWQGSSARATLALNSAAQILSLGELSDDPQTASSLTSAIGSSRFPKSSRRVISMLRQAEDLGYFSAWQ